MARYNATPHDKLLVNRLGGPLTDRSVRRILDKYIKKLALRKKCFAAYNTAYLCHSFAGPRCGFEGGAGAFGPC